MAYILKHAVFRLPIICVVLFTLFLPLLSGSNFSCVVQHSETYCCFVCVSVCRTQQTYCCFVCVSVCRTQQTYCCFVCVSVCRTLRNLLLFRLCQCVQNTAKPTAVSSVSVCAEHSKPTAVLSVSVCAEHSETYCCFVSLCQCVQNTANLLLFFQSVSVCAEHNETYCCFVCVSVCRIVLFPSLSFACLPKTSVVRMYVHERNAILMLQQICMFVGISALILLSVRGYMRL